MVKSMIGIAVGKGSSGLQALKYAVEKEEILEGGDMMVFLLHVYPPVRWVTGPCKSLSLSPFPFTYLVFPFCW